MTVLLLLSPEGRAEWATLLFILFLFSMPSQPQKRLITFREGKSVGICQFCDTGNAQTKREIQSGNQPTTDLCDFHKIPENRPPEWR